MIIWTFVISGSEEFSIFVPNNPVLDYQGSMTVWKFLGTEIQMSELKTYIENNFRVTVDVHSTVMTQKSESAHFFPTVNCPFCIFLDLETPTLCGLADWDISKIDAVLKYHEKAESDLQNCPLKKNHQG